jgi:hypothetical protein
MDTKLCTRVLIARCAVLLGHSHRAGDATDQLALHEELRWLAADAQRWGVRPEVIMDGVLAELLRLHDSGTAHALHARLDQTFGLRRFVV